MGNVHEETRDLRVWRNALNSIYMEKAEVERLRVKLEDEHLFGSRWVVEIRFERALKRLERAQAEEKKAWIDVKRTAPKGIVEGE